MPYYDVEAAAGAGAAVEHETEVARLAFRSDWLRQLGLAPTDAAVIQVQGDSMSPIIRSGDIVLVDSADAEPREGIYILLLDGLLVAKRLQRDFHGGLIIRSDNPAYEPVALQTDQMDGLSIVGRAVWSGGVLR